MRRWVQWLVGMAVAAIACALALRFGPAVLLVLALAAPATEVWLKPLGATWAREEIGLEADARALAADLYRPRASRGALLLVHGLSRAGRRQPDLERLARLLAQRGLLVLVPHFEGLAAFRLSGREVAEISAGLRHLKGLSDTVGVVGFSFGAGPALLAAAETPGLALVGSFGGYADLRHVITFVTTGVHRHAGARWAGRQEDYNRWKLLALLVAFVDDPRDRERLEIVAARKLAHPRDDTRAIEGTLGAGARALLALAVNRREEAVADLLAALPPRVQEALEQLSPLRVMPRQRTRVLIAHGVGDDSIPFTESVRLAEASPGPGSARLVLLRSFHHTGPPGAWRSLVDGLADGWRLLGLTDDLLSHTRPAGVI